MDLVITSRQNRFIKYLRELKEKRNREIEGRFVIEGVKFVAEALQSGVQPEKLVVSDHGMNSPPISELVFGYPNQGQVVRITDPVMEYVCETNTPQGIMALIKMPEISLDALKTSDDSIFAVIDGVQDPGNVGTIIRTADAFGAGGVILTRGCADLYNAKTLRSTMGSVFHIPVIREAEAANIKDFLRRHSLFTAVTGVDTNASEIQEVRLDFPLALVFGSEGRGVSGELTGLGDIMIKIPMAGAAESLNVAVAAGIAFYEALRQHGSKANQTCK